jgi:hypothetical protein
MYGRLSGLVGQVERSTDRQAELADCSEQAGILPLVGDKRTGLSLLQIALGRALMADWTSEQVAQLREYFNAGLTASAIAEQTGRTRPPLQHARPLPNGLASFGFGPQPDRRAVTSPVFRRRIKAL